MAGDVEVNDGPSMVPENQEADQNAEVRGRYCEEVGLSAAGVARIWSSSRRSIVTTCSAPIEAPV
jgi:hypothetical protein